MQLFIYLIPVIHQTPILTQFPSSHHPLVTFYWQSGLLSPFIRIELVERKLPSSVGNSRHRHKMSFRKAEMKRENIEALQRAHAIQEEGVPSPRVLLLMGIPGKFITRLHVRKMNIRVVKRLTGFANG